MLVKSLMSMVPLRKETLGKLGVLGQTPSQLAFGKLGVEGPLRRKIGENPSWLYTDFRLLRTAFLKLLLSQNEFCGCAIFAKSLKR